MEVGLHNLAFVRLGVLLPVMATVPSVSKHAYQQSVRLAWLACDITSWYPSETTSVSVRRVRVGQMMCDEQASRLIAYPSCTGRDQ